MDLAEAEGNYKAISSTRLYRVEDWRVQKTSVVVAYFNKALRPNDYLFINSVIVWVLAVIGLAISLSSIWDDLNGLAIGVALLYLGICFLIGSSVVY